MRAMILVGIFLVGCSPGETGAGEDDNDRVIRPVLAGRLENRDIDEASGIVRSQTTAGVYWVINDSGKPRLHPIDERGQALGRVDGDHDGAAAELNRMMGARAFTYGQHIYFGRGHYEPTTRRGMRSRRPCSPRSRSMRRTSSSE